MTMQTLPLSAGAMGPMRLSCLLIITKASWKPCTCWQARPMQHSWPSPFRSTRQARPGGANSRKIRYESGNQVYARHVGRLHLLARARQKTLKPINLLIEAARREPFSGIGKPEPLLVNLSGYWSRRIDDTHRLVYTVQDADFDVIACRGHYDA